MQRSRVLRLEQMSKICFAMFAGSYFESLAVLAVPLARWVAVSVGSAGQPRFNSQYSRPGSGVDAQRHGFSYTVNQVRHIP